MIDVARMSTLSVNTGNRILSPKVKDHPHYVHMFYQRALINWDPLYLHYVYVLNPFEAVHVLNINLICASQKQVNALLQNHVHKYL